jgi:DNA-binding NtrC family response regulator
MGEKVRILVVDDDENILKTFADVLEDAGYHVDTAKTGEEGIRKSQTDFYHLALLDIRLPDMEGTELLVRMKDTTPAMVKIMVTGYPSLSNAIEAVNEGADGYIVKPVAVDELLKMIKNHLKKQQEARKYSEEKVKEFVESRVKELGKQ